MYCVHSVCSNNQIKNNIIFFFPCKAEAEVAASGLCLDQLHAWLDPELIHVYSPDRVR